MKKDIHPKSHDLTIMVGDETFQTKSTFAGGQLRMDVNFQDHPAWNKSKMNVVNKTNKHIVGFKQKFGNLFK